MKLTLLAAGLALLGATEADARAGGRMSFGSRGGRTFTAPAPTRTAPRTNPLRVAPPPPSAPAKPIRRLFAPTPVPSSPALASPTPTFDSSSGSWLMPFMIGRATAPSYRPAPVIIYRDREDRDDRSSVVDSSVTVEDDDDDGGRLLPIVFVAIGGCVIAAFIRAALNETARSSVRPAGSRICRYCGNPRSECGCGAAGPKG